MELYNNKCRRCGTEWICTPTPESSCSSVKEKITDLNYKLVGCLCFECWITDTPFSIETIKNDIESLCFSYACSKYKKGELEAKLVSLLL